MRGSCDSAAKIAREVQRARIHFYSEVTPGRVRQWMMHPVGSLERVGELVDAADSILVLPQATLTLTRLPA